MFLIIYVTKDLKQWKIHMNGDKPAAYASLVNAQAAAETLTRDMHDHGIPIATMIVEKR